MKSANADWKQQAGQRQDRQAAALNARLDQKSQELAAYQQQNQATAPPIRPPRLSRMFSSRPSAMSSSSRRKRSATRSSRSRSSNATRSTSRPTEWRHGSQQQQERNSVGASPEAARKKLDNQQKSASTSAWHPVARRSPSPRRTTQPDQRPGMSRDQGEMQQGYNQDWRPADQRAEQARQVDSRPGPSPKGAR